MLRSRRTSRAGIVQARDPDFGLVAGNHSKMIGRPSIQPRQKCRVGGRVCTRARCVAGIGGDRNSVFHASDGRDRSRPMDCAAIRGGAGCHIAEPGLCASGQAEPKHD